jgi:hypothetical protein
MNEIKNHGPYFQMDSKLQHDGNHLDAGWYFLVNRGDELLDVAGPFDDEAEAIFAMERAA